MIRIVIFATMLPFLVGCGWLGGESTEVEDTVWEDDGNEGWPFFWWGETTIEERILEAGTIVRARLVSNSLDVVQGEGRWEEWYYIFQTFELAVSEYLVGSGPATIRAVLEMTGEYDSEEEARADVVAVEARRNTEWDDREAIFFLKDGEKSRFVEYFEEAPVGTHYFGDEAYEERPRKDMYSLDSPGNRLWLPADTRSSASGDGQVFLMAPIGANLHYRGGQTMPDTITLGELKANIAALNAELAGGDGTDSYWWCVLGTYEQKRMDAYFGREGGSQYIKHRSLSLGSGKAGGTVIHSDGGIGVALSDGMRTKVTLGGEDSEYFVVREGDEFSSPPDDGSPRMLFVVHVDAARPLAAGEYVFEQNYVPVGLSYCGSTFTSEWTVTVTPPDGTRHELLFDPVAVGGAVGADATNGGLVGGSYWDWPGYTGRIESIRWEDGAVRVTVGPHIRLTAEVLDFIGMDGGVTVSFDAADAVSFVEWPNIVYTWDVASRPWDDGDKLMVRIRGGEAVGEVTVEADGPGAQEGSSAVAGGGS